MKDFTLIIFFFLFMKGFKCCVHSFTGIICIWVCALWVVLKFPQYWPGCHRLFNPDSHLHFKRRIVTPLMSIVSTKYTVCLSYFFQSCCPSSHGLQPKKPCAGVEVPPASIWIPHQWILAPSVTSVTSVANNNGDNVMVQGAVHRSPLIYLTADKNTGKPQLGDCRWRLCKQSSPQMGSFASIWGQKDHKAHHEWKWKERRKGRGTSFNAERFYDIISYLTLYWDITNSSKFYFCYLLI